MSDREDYKIYVGNLAYDVTEREVRRHFEKYGDVDEGGTSIIERHCHVINDSKIKLLIKMLACLKFLQRLENSNLANLVALRNSKLCFSTVLRNFF